MGRSKPPTILFVTAIFHDWWALMSCAAFTVVGIWAAYAEKGREWVLWTSFTLAVVFVFVAAYKAWAREHELWLQERRKVDALTAKPNVTFAVHGIFAHVMQGDQWVVILPDVTIANQSNGLRVSLTADLWMLRSPGGVETWCSPEAKPVMAWEQSSHSYGNKLLVLPLNLEPRSADMGYLAFSHRVKGIGNEPLVDEHGHLRYRIDFKDIHSGTIIHQQEITVPPHMDGAWTRQI
jgi:hypothetical protein